MGEGKDSGNLTSLGPAWVEMIRAAVAGEMLEVGVCACSCHTRPGAGSDADEDEDCIVFDATGQWHEALQTMVLRDASASYATCNLCGETPGQATVAVSAMDRLIARRELLAEEAELHARRNQVIQRLAARGGSQNPVRYRCGACGSEELAFDAHADFDPTSGEYDLVTTYDKGQVCLECDVEDDVLEVPMSAHEAISSMAALRQRCEAAARELALLDAAIAAAGIPTGSTTTEARIASADNTCS